MARMWARCTEKATKAEKEKKWAERVASKRLAEDDPEQFLRDMFYDTDGVNDGAPPEKFEAGCGLHQGVTSMRLFHQTVMDDVIVLGSRKNDLGQELHDRLSRAFGWSLQRYQHWWALLVGRKTMTTMTVIGM